MAVALAAGPQAASAAETLVRPHAGAFGPQVAVSRYGGAMAAWVRGEDRHVTIPVRAKSRVVDKRIQVAYGSPGAGFSRRQTLAHLHDPFAGGPLLAHDHRGDGIIAWRGDDGRVRFAVTLSQSGRFGEPKALGHRGHLCDVAAAPKLWIAIAWLSGDTLRVAPGSVDGGLYPAFELPVDDGSCAAIDINRNGTVMALVEDDSGARVWLRHPDGELESPARVPGWTTSGVSAALQPDDSVVALLSGYRSEIGLAASYRAPGGRFTKPEPIDRHGAFPELTSDPEGGVTAAWSIYDDEGRPNGVAAATAPHGGRFGKPVRFVRRGAWGPAVAAAGNGRRAMVFNQNGSAHRPDSLREIHWQRGGKLRGLRVLDSHYRPDHVVGIDDHGRGFAVWNGRGKNHREQGIFYAEVDTHPGR